MRRFGVASVKNAPPAVLLVSGLNDADTLTTKRSTLATRSNGKGASVRRVLVDPSLATPVASLHVTVARRSVPISGNRRRITGHRSTLMMI
jgi:hypothetical protein